MQVHGPKSLGVEPLVYTKFFPQYFSEDGSRKLIACVIRCGREVALSRRNCRILPKQLQKQGKGVH